jgi:hypothetical protein
MKSLSAESGGQLAKRCAVVMILIGILATLPLLSGAHTATTTTITIINNSSREIRHVYLSAPNQDNWGPDQLNHSVIAAGGGSFTLSNVSCSSSEIRVIAEDQNGCFVYHVDACGGSATWTITNDAAPDCGN